MLILLTSSLTAGEWSPSRPGRFTPEEKTPGTHWIRGWVGPQSQSGRLGEEKILDATGTRTPDFLIAHPVASRYTDYAIPAPCLIKYGDKLSFVLYIMYCPLRGINVLPRNTGSLTKKLNPVALVRKLTIPTE
jgi:hypothetical protein